MKSPECRITPCGVWNAMAIASGTEWVTGMNSTSTGADLHRLAVADRHEAGAVGQPGLFDPVPGQPDRELGAVDRRLQLAQQVGQAARVVFVPVGEDDPVDPVPAIVQVGELGQDQVDAGHVGVGEHDPAVEDDDAAVDLDAGAVATDLTETAEEDDPDGLRLSCDQPSDGDRDRRWPRAARIFAAWASSSGVAAPMGRRHWPTRRPSARRPPWPAAGSGTPALDSKSKESSSSA